MMVLPIVLGALSPIVFLRGTSSKMSKIINFRPITHNKRWLLRYDIMFSLYFILFSFCFSAKFISHTILNVALLVLPSIYFTMAFSLWLSTYW
jgi:hypothetical protein